MIKRFFEINFFFSNILAPLISLALYCFSFAYFSSHFLIQGVNYYFVSKLGKYVLVMVAAAILAFAIIWKMRPDDKLVLKNSKEFLDTSDLFLLLLPLTPVIEYLLKNRDIVPLSQSVYMVIIFGVFSCLYIYTLPALFSKWISPRTLMILGFAFVFTIVNMAAVSSHYAWFEKGSLRKQLVVLGGVFLIASLFYNINSRKILYYLLAINLLVTGSTQLLSQAAKPHSPGTTIQENQLFALVGKRKPATEPDIYLLIYDAYVPNETMIGYGIDNSAQENYLKGQGFQPYPHTYSIASASVETMSRVLNASIEFYGEKRRAVSGDGVTQEILKSLGYKTYGIFPNDFLFLGVGSSYDYSIPKNFIRPYVPLLKSILIGEFRFNIEDIGADKQLRDQFLENKRRIFEQVPGNRVFIYMHSNLPSHSQNSGACLPNETDLFKDRLKRANVEMKQDIDLIVKHDPHAIVIIAGDHGPYLTKNCTSTTDVYDASEINRVDIQDRIGTFLAIRWPTGDFEKYDDITVLQDVFPAIFAYLYQDPRILEAKIAPVTVIPNSISDVSVDHGIIHGGVNDGEPLFLSGNK